MGKEKYVELQYGGIYVNSKQAEKLKKEGPSDFLKIEKFNNDEYHVRPKLPERGMDEKGNTFNIRKNINIFVKGLAAHAFDKNGNFDFKRFDTFMTEIVNDIGFGEITPERLARELNIKPEDREDFAAFFSANESLLSHIGEGFDVEMLKLKQFSYAADNLYSGKHADSIAEQEKYLKESYDDFKSLVSNIRRLANENEEELDYILFPLDCLNSSAMFHLFTKQVNRLKGNDEQIDGEAMQINIAEETKDEMERREAMGEKTDRTFDVHQVYIAQVGKKNDPDAFVISLETTAPPKGKFIFNDSKGVNACGIFESAEEVKKYHIERSIIPKQSEVAEKIVRRANEHDLQNYTTPIGDVMYFELEKRIAVKETHHSIDSLSLRLDSSDVDHPLKKSSPQFKKMKEAFEKLSEAKTEKDKILFTKKVNILAQQYLEFKEPMGDKKAENALSDYAKRRIEFAKDVLEFTSAELNNRKIKPTIASRTGKLYSILAGKFAEPGETEAVTKANADKILRSPTFAKIVKGLTDDDIKNLLKTPENTLQITYRNIDNAEKMLKEDKMKLKPSQPKADFENPQINF